MIGKIFSRHTKLLKVTIIAQFSCVLILLGACGSEIADPKVFAIRKEFKKLSQNKISVETFEDWFRKETGSQVVGISCLANNREVPCSGKYQLLDKRQNCEFRFSSYRYRSLCNNQIVTRYCVAPNGKISNAEIYDGGYC